MAALLAALLATGLPSPVAGQESRGSAVPCAVPLGWHLAEVDPRFGLDEDRVLQAVEAAVGLWEEAVDRPLFVHDPEGTLPIRLVFDERQAALRARQEREEELRDRGSRLDSARAEIQSRQDELARLHESHREAVERLGEEMEAHNAEVQRWNASGGAPDSVRSALTERAAVLDRAGRALRRQAEELGERQAALTREVRRLNERIEARNLQIRDFARAWPRTITEAGRYDERVERSGGEVRILRREIRVFRFEDGDALVLVLAHELGHALGLGHTDVPEAVMSTVVGGGPETGLHPADLRLLARTCPALR